MCVGSRLSILNGRKHGDLKGNFTCYTPRGCSVVDYCVVSESLYDKIINFRIGELPTFTDHCPLYMALEVNCDNCTENEQKKEIHALYRLMNWNKQVQERKYRFRSGG